MIQPVMRDQEFLKIPSTTATNQDLQVATDLLDTLIHHKGGCVGMPPT